MHCRSGYSSQLGTLVLSEDTGHQEGRGDSREESRGESRPRCTLTLNTRQPSPRHLNCDTCFRARRDHTHCLEQMYNIVYHRRVLNVSRAWYADCNGLYTLSNLSAAWDKRRPVYERIHGGTRPQDKRSPD